MSFLLIPPGQSLIEEIIPRLDGAAPDFSCNAVIFPGKRPSHFLRKALARRTGKSFVPPAIFSMDEFIDEVFDDIKSARRLETIDAVSILFDLHKSAKERLGGEGFITPDSFFPIGLKIYRDIEELYIEGISVARVREIQPFAGEAVPEQTLKRLQSLSFFYEQFYEAVGARGFSTRSVRYRAAAEAIGEASLEKYSRIICSGFFAFTESEKRLFRKLHALDRTVFIFQNGPGVRQRIMELGAAPEGAEATEDGPEPEIHFYSCPDTHGQVYALSGVLGPIRDRDGALDEKTAIVVPSSDALFPLLRQGLGICAEEEYNISLGYPLHRTAIFGFLNNLMELVSSMDGDRVYIPDYLRFVLHPYTKNIYFNGSSEITRVMFHALEEALTKRRSGTFSTMQEIEEGANFSGQIAGRIAYLGEGVGAQDIGKHIKAIHRATIGKFLSFENVRDFFTKCGEVLTYIFNNSTARLHPLFYPFSESFIRSLDTVAGSLMKDIAFVERSSYFTFFRKFIMTCHTPFAGTPLRGLQVLGFLETRNIKFDRVFVLDANEGTMPNTAREDTLLPLQARQMLGLPTYLDRDRLAAYYFGNLVKGAKEVHLFFSEGDSKERSRFVEQLLWERQKKEKSPDARKYVKLLQYKVRLTNSGPEEIQKTAEVAGYLKGFTYSATALDKYLKCPLQFYYSYVLRIDKVREMSGEVERADIGKIVHKAISTYFSGRKGFVLRGKDLSASDMDRVADDLFRKEYGDNMVGPVYLFKRQTKKHLQDLLKKYYLKMVENHSVTILGNELDLENIRIGPFNARGRLDSVEKRDDKTCIIDYKTGSQPGRLKIDFKKLAPDDRQTWPEAIGSLQLPFYLMLYSERSRVKMEDLEGMFLLLGRSVINEQIELPLFDGPSGESYCEILKTVILKLLAEIADQQVAFTPTTRKKETCPYCDFQFICGTQWVVK